MAYDGVLKFETATDVSGFQNGANKLESIVKGLGVFKVIEKGMELVSRSIGGAVSRYDTLNRFPRVMEQMGYGAEVAEASIGKMSDSIQGLPTRLDDIVGSAQRLSISLGSLEKGTDSAISLNNAFLAGGATSEAAARGMEQYIQALSRNKMEMQEWKILQETMPYALQKTAEAFNYTGTQAIPQLYDALKSGDITMVQFNDKLIELNGGIGGFAEVAKTATGGIGTAMTNLQTRTAIGITKIIESIDKGLSETRFKSIENIINTTSTSIKNALAGVASAFQFVAENAEVLVPALIAIGTAVTMWKIGGVLTGIIGGFQAATLQVALYAMSVGVANAATGKSVITEVAHLSSLKAKEIVVGLLTGKIALATAAQYVWNAAMNANHIGLLIIGVSALVGIVAVLATALNKSSQAFREEEKAIKDATKAHKEYTEQLKQDKAAAEAARKEKLAEVEANRRAVQSLQMLIDKNKESGDQNHAIADSVNALNESMTGLGLTYDSVTGQLNMTSEELEAYLANMEKVQQNQADQEEYNLLLSEQTRIQSELAAQEERRANVLAMHQKGLISSREAGKLYDEINKYVKELTDSEVELGTQVDTAKVKMEGSYDAQAVAAVKAQQIRNGEMATVRKYASLWGWSADRVIEEASNLGGGLDELAGKQSKFVTSSGMTLDMAAEKWGMTEEAISSTLDIAGMSLEEFDDFLESKITEEGETLLDLATKWGTSTQVLDREMKMQGLSLQGLSDKYENYADRYNMSSKEVRQGIEAMGGDVKAWAAEQERILRSTQVREQAYIEQIKAGNIEISDSYAQALAARRLNGEELNNVEQATLDQWLSVNNAAAEAYKAQQQEIIDAAEIGASKIVVSKQQSAKKILEIQAANNKATAQYVDNYNFIYDQIPEEQRKYLAEIGVDNARFLSDMVKKWDKGGKEQWESYIDGLELSEEQAAQLRGAGEEAGQTVLDGVESNSEGFEQAGEGIADNVGAGMEESTAASDAAQDIADAVVEDLNSADYSGITAGIATAITTGTGNVTASASEMCAGVLKIMSAAQREAHNIAILTMTDINSVIIIRTPNLTTSAAATASAISTNLSFMVAGGTSAASQMMDGMLRAMEEKAHLLYEKAQEIADTISDTLRSSWDEHSPSRVSYGIMEYYMVAMYNAMDDLEGLLFGKTEAIADGITDRLEISPDVTAAMTSRLRAVVDASPFSTNPADLFSDGYAGMHTGVSYTNNLTQNITTPKPLSESEMTREAQDMLNRQRWSLP